MGSEIISVVDSHSEDEQVNGSFLPSNIGLLSEGLPVVTDTELKDNKHMETLESVVNELSNVEGYNTEPWGSAVDISNLNEFYPKKLTFAGTLTEDEFMEFMASSSETAESTEDIADNYDDHCVVNDLNDFTVPENLSPVSKPIENGTYVTEADVAFDEDKAEDVAESLEYGMEIVDEEKSDEEFNEDKVDDVVESLEHGMEILDDKADVELNEDKTDDVAESLEHEMEILDDVVNAKNPAEYFGPLGYSTTDPKCPSPAQDYTQYLDKDINEIPDEVITPGFVLDFVLREGNKHEGLALDVDVESTSHFETASVNEIAAYIGSQDPTQLVNSLCEKNETEATPQTVEPPVGPLDEETVTAPNVDVTSPNTGDSHQNSVPSGKDCHTVDQMLSPPEPSVPQSISKDPLPDLPHSATSSPHPSIKACSVVLTRLPLSKLNSVQMQAILQKRKAGNIEAAPDSVIQSEESGSLTLTQSQTKCKDSSGDVPIAKILSKEVGSSSRAALPVVTGPMGYIVKVQRTVEDEEVNVDTDDDDDVPKIPLITEIDKSKETLKLTSSPSRRSLRNSSVISSKSSDSAASGENLKKMKALDDSQVTAKNQDKLASNTQTMIQKATAAPEITAPDSPDKTKENRNTRSGKRKCETNISKPTAKVVIPPVVKNPGEKPISQMTVRDILNFLKTESKKSSPNFCRLSEAMSKTYETKRKPLYKNNETGIEDILKFPEMMHYQMIKEEYGRIQNDICKMRELENELAGPISSALEPKKKGKKTRGKKQKRHALWEQALKLWEEHKPDPLYCKILGLIVICFEFAEDAVVSQLCKILKPGEQPSEKEIDRMVTPTIVVQESDIFKVDGDCEIWIYVDCQKYLRVPNMYEAVLSAFACHYLLNIHYHSKLKSLFEFFDMLNGNSQTTYNKT